MPTILDTGNPMFEESPTIAPLGAPVECFDITHPAVPRGKFNGVSSNSGTSGGEGLEGFRILHISDLHIRRFPTWSSKRRALCRALAAVRCDLVAITGDLMDHPGDEDAAIAAVRMMLEALPRPTLAGTDGRGGAFAVLGNHDSTTLARRLEREVHGLKLLNNRSTDVAINSAHGITLRVLGWSWPEDPLGAVLSGHGEARGEGMRACANPLPAAFTLTLAHMPGMIFCAADLGLPLLLAGHTHAGQIRVSERFAPHTSSDVPSHLAAGVLRLRSTLCCISRGVGDGVMHGLRINCPWQVPLYTLRHGALMRIEGEEHAATVVQVRGW